MPAQTSRKVLRWKIKEFLKENGGVSVYRFAKDSGLSETTAYRLAGNYGNSSPKITQLKMIMDYLEALTGRDVELSEVVEWVHGK